MILTGSLGDCAAPEITTKADLYKRSWKKTQYLADCFWDRWIKEYLQLLQPRQKWFGASPNLTPGDMVLVMNEHVRRGLWPKAIVEEVMPDYNNLIRRVRVRTTESTIIRDIRKLCLLEGVVRY